MKFTSEDLLNAMGLKVNDVVYIQSRNMKYIVKIPDWSKNPLLINLDSSTDAHMWLVDILNEEFEIIQPKPTLTEDEKVILRNLPDYCNKYIARDINGDISGCDSKPIREGIIWELREGYRCYLPFEHLFLFINPMECYSIEELLKD